jgi:hypothetical protein
MRFSRGVASKTAPAPLKWDGHAVVRWNPTLHHAAFGWPFVELSSRAGCDRLSFCSAQTCSPSLCPLFVLPTGMGGHGRRSRLQVMSQPQLSRSDVASHDRLGGWAACATGEGEGGVQLLLA